MNVSAVMLEYTVCISTEIDMLTLQGTMYAHNTRNGV